MSEKPLKESPKIERKLLKTSLAEATPLALAIKEAGGRALVVGGWVRDELRRRLGQTSEDSKDIDIEVYGIQPDKLLEILNQFGTPNKVGKAFGVIKLGGLDVSIPRRDSKTGDGHKDFIVEGDPTMTPKEAAKRRDLTINALAIDPLTGDIIDEYGGLEDLKNGILRATDLATYDEDALRVLRLMQFAARFNYTVDEKTADLARTIPLDKIPAGRISEEMTKLLMKAKKPSVGLEWARRLLVIEKLFPELHALIGVPQEPEWHPEGDVWTHTCMVADAAADIVRREKLNNEQKLLIMLGSLLHDLGKADTTAYEPNKKGELAWRSLKHAEAGVKPLLAMLSRLEFPEIKADVLATKLSALVREHLWPGLNRNPSDSAVRKLAKRLEPVSIYELVMVAEADHRGRALPWHGYPPAKELLEQAQRLRVEYKPPEEFVKGRHLLARGYLPGPHIGAALRHAYQAQLDGHVVDHEMALNYALDYLKDQAF